MRAVRSPELVRSLGLAVIFLSSLETDYFSRLDQTFPLQDAEDGALRYIPPLFVNKLTGKLRTVDFPIYYAYGIDDLRSCIDFLMDVKHWKETTVKKKKGIDAVELGLHATRDTLIRNIEMSSREEELQQVATDVWLDIEESIKPKRKRRYS